MLQSKAGRRVLRRYGGRRVLRRYVWRRVLQRYGGRMFKIGAAGRVVLDVACGFYASCVGYRVVIFMTRVS